MHYIDIFLLLLFLGAMLLGFIKGFLSTFLTLIGLFLTLLFVSRFGPMVKYGIMIRFSFDDFFSSLLAYLLIIIMVAILISLIRVILNYTKKSKYSFLNKVLGAVFYVFNVLVALAIILTLLSYLQLFTSFVEQLNESLIITEIYRMLEYVKYKGSQDLLERFFA